MNDGRTVVDAGLNRIPIHYDGESVFGVRLDRDRRFRAVEERPSLVLGDPKIVSVHTTTDQKLLLSTKRTTTPTVLTGAGPVLKTASITTSARPASYVATHAPPTVLGAGPYVVSPSPTNSHAPLCTVQATPAPPVESGSPRPSLAPSARTGKLRSTVFEALSCRNARPVSAVFPPWPE